MRAYVVTVLGVLACGLFLVGLLDALVDPFGVLPSPVIEGVNVPKTEVGDYARLYKAHAVRWRRPTAVILGSSTAIIGLDPAHPGWRTARPYNLALPGASVYQMRRYLEHALAVGPLDRVVIGLDFSAFNAYFRFDQDFDEGRLRIASDGSPAAGRPLEPLAVTLSMDALRASLGTVRKNRGNAFGPVCGPDGRCWMRAEREWVKRERGVRRVFGLFERGFLWRFWFPPPLAKYAFTDPEIRRSPFEELARILELARRHRFDLRLFISPSHARLSEARIAVGLGDEFEEWKRTLARLVAEPADGERPVPLWDFSGYHPLTAEEFPESVDPGATMRWHMDSVHYRKDLGDLVLDRLFAHREPGREVPAGFGVELTPANVEGHLARVREEHE
ncbi:MAG: hypothetical protein ACREQ9_25235, partial [Candidatus Binatia bacterium]